MKKAYIISALLIIGLVLNTQAQDKWALTYSIGVPSGDTSDNFDKTSWRGFSVDYNHFVNNNLTIGFSAGWQTFDSNRGYVTETSGTETLSGFRYNYLNNLPILATGHYFLNPDNDFSPYIGVGLGFGYTEFMEDTGNFRRENTGWAFTVRPEIGMDYEINYQVGIRAAVRYHYASSVNSVPSLPYLAFNIGFVWTH